MITIQSGCECLRTVPNIVCRINPKGTRIPTEKFAAWARKEKRLLVTDTTLRDAHQSLFATRMRTEDMLNAADAIAQFTFGHHLDKEWGGISAGQATWALELGMGDEHGRQA